MPIRLITATTCGRTSSAFDYSVDDALSFHEAIKATVVPAAKRIYERRRQRWASIRCARGTCWWMSLIGRR